MNGKVVKDHMVVKKEWIKVEKIEIDSTERGGK